MGPVGGRGGGEEFSSVFSSFLLCAQGSPLQADTWNQGKQPSGICVWTSRMQPAAEHGDSVRVDSQIIISSLCLLAFGEKSLEGGGVLGVAGATRWCDLHI